MLRVFIKINSKSIADGQLVPYVLDKLKTAIKPFTNRSRNNQYVFFFNIVTFPYSSQKFFASADHPGNEDPNPPEALGFQIETMNPYYK